LSPGQGDVGTLQAYVRSSAFGHPGGNEIFNVLRERKSMRFAKNAACGRGMGKHDFLIVIASGSTMNATVGI